MKQKQNKTGISHLDLYLDIDVDSRDDDSSIYFIEFK